MTQAHDLFTYLCITPKRTKNTLHILELFRGLDAGQIVVKNQLVVFNQSKTNIQTGVYIYIYISDQIGS